MELKVGVAVLEDFYKKIIFLMFHIFHEKREFTCFSNKMIHVNNSFSQLSLHHNPMCYFLNRMVMRLFPIIL